MQIKKTIDVILRALKGEHHDYTQGRISEAVILLAIPMVLEIGLESVFALVDMFFVSGLGANAIATVGLTEAVLSIIYSVGIGVGAGATAIVARRTGEKETEAADHAGAQAIIITAGLGICLGALGVIFAADVLHLMGASAEVVREGQWFTRISFGSSVVILLLFVINGVFRGAGDAAMAMKSLWIASGVNIILCPILIHFYGLPGAALATLIGRTSGVIYQCHHLVKGDGVLKMRASHFRYAPAISKNIVKIAWPATIQFLIGSGSWILLTKLVADTGGTEASAGYQIAFRNFVFFILPAWGLSNAAATLMGQNLGAKQYDRAEQSVLVTAKYGFVFMLAVTAFLMLLAEPIISVFTSDPTVFAYGVEGLRIISSGFVFYGISMIITQALNGAGDTKTPTQLNFFCFWIFQMPLAYWLVYYTQMKVAGALIVIPISHALLTVIAWWVFKRGKWREIRV